MLAFSAQSFAPFAFSAMAFAIEELIEEIQAGRVNGSGKAAQAVRRAPQRPPDRPARRDVTEEEVRAQWELLELRRQAQRLSDAEQLHAPPPPTITRESAAAPAHEAPAATPETAAEPDTSRADDEALALLLMMAEA